MENLNELKVQEINSEEMVSINGGGKYWNGFKDFVKSVGKSLREGDSPLTAGFRYWWNHPMKAY